MKHNKLPVVGQLIRWAFLLVFLAGCSTIGSKPTPQPAQPSPTVGQIEAPQGSYDPPSWVVVSEMDFGQPSISTKFLDESFGITTDLGGGIHVTQDGGQIWEYKQDAAFSRVALEIVNEDLIWHIGVGGHVIRSMDGGETWTYLSTLPYGGHIEYTSFIDEKIGWAATTEYGMFWITNDGAQTWQAYPLPEGMGTVAALHLRTQLDGYFLDLDGNLFITDDGGQTWQKRTLGYAQGWQIPELNHAAAMRFTDADSGLIALNIIHEGTARTYVLRTADGGKTWVEEDLPVSIGMYHLTRDGRYLTHVDLHNHGKFILLRSTDMEIGESLRINRDLSVRAIQDNTFVFSHAFPWEANSLAAINGDTLLLVDTPYTPDATQETLDWLESQVGFNQVMAINTHYHPDNLGGNQLLVEQGIPVYGSDMTVDLLKERGQESLDQTIDWLEVETDPRFARTFKDLILVPPTNVFDIEDGLNLSFAGEPINVFYPGPGHSPDNVVVFFPERNLLFGGCMVIGWDAIGSTAVADIDDWLESVRKLDQFEFNILVPGHGERLDPGLIEHTLELLTGN